MMDSQQAIDYRRTRGKRYHENRLRLLTCIFEAINERIPGGTRVVSNSNVHRSLCALFMIYRLKHQIHF